MPGTARSLDVSQVAQNPGDLWFIGTPPTDTAVRLTLAADGTPDSSHAAVHLGPAAGPITVSVAPKWGPINLDQFDAPVDYYVDTMDMMIEAELAQSSAALFARAIGVGTEATGSGYDQVTIGGGTVVPSGCYAAIQRKRLDTDFTKLWVAIIYRAVPQLVPPLLNITRKKPSFWKIKLACTYDFTRTAGKAVGVIYETT